MVLNDVSRGYTLRALFSCETFPASALAGVVIARVTKAAIRIAVARPALALNTKWVAVVSLSAPAAVRSCVTCCK